MACMHGWVGLSRWRWRHFFPYQEWFDVCIYCDAERHHRPAGTVIVKRDRR
jgi:hypothetical protein